MESAIIAIGVLAICMFIYMVFSTPAKQVRDEYNETQVPYNAPETTVMYFPKWKKLKYWQPTKKNPNRR